MNKIIAILCLGASTFSLYCASGYYSDDFVKEAKLLVGLAVFWAIVSILAYIEK